jgi:type IV pilus assembly protein PilV
MTAGQYTERLPMNTPRVLRLRTVRGFSLMEVLVALAILSVGLLGLAALQATALRANQGANFRSQATNASYDVLDMIRANRLNANAYNTNFTSAIPAGTTTAAEDVRRWKINLRNTIGASAQGRVAIAGGVVTVDVRWTDSRAGGDAAGNAQTTFTFTTQI